MQVAPWKSIDAFPRSDSDWGLFFPLFPSRTVADDRQRVEKAFEKPNLLSPVLVSAPETNGRYLPVLAVSSENGAEARQKLIGQRRIVERFSHVYLILIPAALYYFADLRLAVTWFGLNLLLSLYLNLDNRQLRNEDTLRERALFYGWLYYSSRYYVGVAALFFLFIGLLQVALATVHGGNETVLQNFALIYAAISHESEYWRFFSGPFFHGSLGHWAGNGLLGVGLAAICCPFIGYRYFVLVVSGAVFSFVVTYLVQLEFAFASDGIVGLSGGIGASLGWLVASTFRSAEAFPIRFHWTALFFATVSLIIYPLLLDQIVLLCHASGMLIGTLYALSIPKISFVIGIPANN